MMPSGGYRQPSNPAAVSGPGGLSRRVDGGAGSAKQPLRVPTGGKYGEAKALREQQQAAPMPAGNQPASAGGPSAAPAGAAQSAGVFRPTDRPSQPITAGVSQPPGAPPIDADLVLRQAVMQYPSPWLLRLLRSRG